jgi:pimeloyl-ACP methyl ester carboxylesterase
MTTYKPIYKTPAGEQAVMAFYESVLERLPVASQTLTIPTRHGDTFVLSSGETSSPPLILLHGAGTNSAIWAGDLPEYARYFRVYAVDLLGEAGKSAPNRLDWKGPAYAEWLEDVLDAFQLENAVLIGISQGAWTALKFAVYKPERVAKLVLMCPGGVIPDRVSFVLRAIVYSLTGQWGMRNMLKLLYADQPLPQGAAEVTALFMTHFKPRVGVLPIFSDEELRRLTMPMLLLGGTKDALRDIPAIAARLQSHLPHLTLNIIPGAGHALLNTTPHILPFLVDDPVSEGVVKSRRGDLQATEGSRLP